MQGSGHLLPCCLSPVWSPVCVRQQNIFSVSAHISLRPWCSLLPRNGPSSSHICLHVEMQSCSTTFLPLWLPLDVLNLLSPTLHIAHMLLSERQAETVLSSSTNLLMIFQSQCGQSTSQQTYMPSAQFRGTWAIWGMPGYLRHPQRPERSDVGPIRDLIPPIFRHLNYNYYVNKPNTCFFLPLLSPIPCTLLLHELPHNKASCRTNHNSPLFPSCVQGMSVSGGTASPLPEHQSGNNQHGISHLVWSPTAASTARWGGR